MSVCVHAYVEYACVCARVFAHWAGEGFNLA